MRTPILATLALVATAAGCGDDGGSGGDAGPLFGGRTTGSGGDLAVCDAFVEWDERCATGDAAIDGGPSWGETECRTEVAWSYVQRAYIDATASCFESLPCDTSDDQCSEAGFRALGVDDFSDVENDPGYQECAAYAATCDGLSEDMCTAFFVYNDAGRRLAEACLDLPCDEVEACLQHPGAR